MDKPTSHILDPAIVQRRRYSLKARPQDFFIICIVIVIVIPIFCFGQGLLIHLDVPRIYIPADFFMYTVAVMLLLYWIVYNVGKKTLFSLFLARTHICITIFIIVYFIITHRWYFKHLEPDKLKRFILKSVLNNMTREIRLISPLGITFLLGQLAFAWNLIYGIVKRKNAIKSANYIKLTKNNDDLSRG